MSTPSEGPGAWRQGSFLDSADWLRNLSPQEQQGLIDYVGMTPEQRAFATQVASLDERQQANLMRAANTDPLRTRVENAARAAVARVQLAYNDTRGRISDMATALASQARDYRDVAVQGARDTRDTVVQGARDARDTVVQGARNTRDTVVQGAQTARDWAEEQGQRAVGAYEAGRDRVVDAAQRGQVRLDQARQTGADRLSATGQQIAEGARGAREAVVGGARDAAAATREAFGKAGRWFEGKFNGTMLKAESALANYNASRHNPPLQADTTQVFDGQSRLELIQRLSEGMNTPISAQENEAIQNLAQASQTRIEGQTAVHIAMAGVAPLGPGTRVPDRGQTTLGQQTGEHGAQRQTGSNLTKDNDKGGLKR